MVATEDELEDEDRNQSLNINLIILKAMPFIYSHIIHVCINNIIFIVIPF